MKQLKYMNSEGNELSVAWSTARLQISGPAGFVVPARMPLKRSRTHPVQYLTICNGPDEGPGPVSNGGWVPTGLWGPTQGSSMLPNSFLLNELYYGTLCPHNHCHL